MNFLGQIGNFIHQATAPAVNYFQHNVAQPIGQGFSNIGTVVHNEIQQAPQQIHPLVNFIQQAPQVFGNNLQNIRYQMPSATAPFTHAISQIPVNPVMKLGQVPDFAHSFITGPADFAGGLALSARNAVTGEKNSFYQPNNPAMKFIFGNQPVKNLQGQSADMSHNLQQMGINPALASKAGTPLVVGLGLTNLLGGGKKQVLSATEKNLAPIISSFAHNLKASPIVGDIGKELNPTAIEAAIKNLAGKPLTGEHYTDNAIKLANHIQGMRNGLLHNAPAVGLSVNDVKNPLSQQSAQGGPKLLQSGFKTQPMALPPGELNPKAAKDFYKQTGVAPKLLNDLKSGNGSIKAGGETLPPPTINPHDEGTLTKVWNSVTERLTGMGQPTAEAAQRLLASRDTAEKTAGTWKDQLPTFASLNKKETINAVDAIEGNAVPLTPKIAQAVKEAQSVSNNAADQTEGLGILIHRLENHFPHSFPDSMFKGANLQKAIQHLVQTGQAKDAAEAQQLIRQARGVVRDRKQSNLEMPRNLNLPGYEKTKEAYFKYLGEVAHRIGQVTHLGKNDSIILDLLNQHGKLGGDQQAATDLFNIGANAIHRSNPFVSNVLQFNALTKLGKSAIGNATQSVNTITKYGVGPTAKALVQLVKGSPETKSFVNRAGVTFDTALNDLREGYAGKASKWLTPGFNPIERFNRSLAALAGKEHAIDVANKAIKGDGNAMKELEQLGIKLPDTKGLSDADKITAARDAVLKTQFKVDPMDLPSWASSGWGKMIAQFRTFSYNQSKFFNREILQPAIHGNVQPLARYIAFGAPVGYAGYKAKEGINNGIHQLLTGQPPKNQPNNTPMEKIGNNPLWQGIGQAGGTGLLGDLAGQIIPNSYDMTHGKFDKNAYIGNMVGNIGGPTAGLASKVTGATGAALTGDFKPAGRLGLQQIPFAGSGIADALLPSGSKSPTAPGAPKVDTSGITNTGSDLTPVEQQKLKDQISQIDTQEKQALADNGIKPFGYQIGGTTDQQKNDTYNKLEQQKKALQDQLKPKTDYLSQQLTGNTNVDEALLSDQSNQITGLEKQVVADVLKGKIDGASGDKMLEGLKAQQKYIASKIKDLKLGNGELKGKKLSIKGVSFKTTGTKAVKQIKYKKPSTKGVKLPQLKANLKTLSYKQKPFKIK